MIVDTSKNLLPPNGKDYAYAIDTGNTHCTGFSLIKTPWTEEMFSLINSQKRYDALINETSFHEGKKIENSFWQEFTEQASWYSLTGIKDTQIHHFLIFLIMDFIVPKMNGLIILLRI